MATAIPYVPLEELLQRPATRMLRALRFFDWARPSDLYLAANVGDHEKASHSAALSRLASAGFIERGGKSSDGWEYRLTPKGRRELARCLAGVSR